MSYYVLCDDDSRHESMTKEQILAAIKQAVETGTIGDCDAGFITKVKETNGGSYVTFWVGTRAEYNALLTIQRNCVYIITDDTTNEDIEKAIADATKAAEEARGAIAGSAAIDISDKIALQMSVEALEEAEQGGMTSHEISWKHYYVPNLGIVFYRCVITITGKLAAGTALKHEHIGGYAPSSIGVGACSGPFNALYFSMLDTTKFNVIAEQEIEQTAEGYGRAIYVSGWYFCDGE